MSQRSDNRSKIPAAARVFGDLQAEDALTPGSVSTLRRGGALFLVLLFVSATPLFFAAYAAGVIGDTPTAIAKSNSGPGGDDEDNSGPGSSGGDDDDTGTRLGTDDTSRNNADTRGTTNDNDTNTSTGTNTGTNTGGDDATGTGQTRTRTGS